jgi:hypothetical protein
VLRFETGKHTDPKRERRFTALFCSLLFVNVFSAHFHAAENLEIRIPPPMRFLILTGKVINLIVP